MSDVNKLLQERKIDELVDKYAELEDTEYLFNMIVLYGTIEDIKKYHQVLIDYDTFVLDNTIIRNIKFDILKIQYVLENELVDSEMIYNLVRYNYTCVRYVNKDTILNFAQIISESMINFRYLVDTFLEAGYNYKHMVMSYYDNCNMLAYIINDKSGKHDCNDLIKFFETLLVFDRGLLIQLFKITKSKTILSSNIGIRTELHQKIIRYIKGRKLVDEISEEDEFLSQVKSNVGIPIKF